MTHGIDFRQSPQRLYSILGLVSPSSKDLFSAECERLSQYFSLLRSIIFVIYDENYAAREALKHLSTFNIII